MDLADTECALGDDDAFDESIPESVFSEHVVVATELALSADSGLGFNTVVVESS